MDSNFRFFEEKSNLTKEELVTLHSLTRNKELVIKPADKGSTVVLMDKEQYIREAERQLELNTSHPVHYRQGPRRNSTIT